MLDQATLDDVIERIVEVAEPEKIILFGSAARGDADANSDIDLLVIKEGSGRARPHGAHLRRLRGVGAIITRSWSRPRTWSATRTATR